MNTKSKGTNAERELIHLFWKYGWAACRVAGSGSMHYPSPDILAGRDGRLIVLECKVTASSSQYFSYDEVSDFKRFAVIIKAEPWLAVKFNHIGWFFVLPEDLKDTGKMNVLSLDTAKLRGVQFEDLVK